MSSELIERLEKRAKTYSWDSTTFYASDADLMLKSAAKLAQLQAELAEAWDELRRLIESIWKTEYQQEAPEWKPLPDLIGMITQMDNMYAGVRGQRDQTREVPGRIAEWLRSIGDWPLATSHAELLATAIEARDWSKP